MDLLALVEVERLDRCNRGGGGEIEDAGWNWLNFIFCLLNLHGFAHFTIK